MKNIYRINPIGRQHFVQLLTLSGTLLQSLTSTPGNLSRAQMLRARLRSPVTQRLWYHYGGAPRARLGMITDKFVSHIFTLFVYFSYAHVSAAVTFKGPAARNSRGVFLFTVNPSDLRLVILSLLSYIDKSKSET
jgi:hypothetical protein